MKCKICILGFCIIIMACNNKADEEIYPSDIVRAGYIPDKYSFYNRYGPDTIYRENKGYDFNNDSVQDFLFHSTEYEYDDHGRPGYGCESSIYIKNSTASIAPFKYWWSVEIIHYGDVIDTSYRWQWHPWQSYGYYISLNRILTTRNVVDTFYWDATGYIGLRLDENIGWLKLRVEGCSKIILYECLIN